MSKIDGQALVRNELHQILLTLHEAEKANERRKPGEPLDQEFALNILSGSHRLNLIAKILLACVMFVAALGLVRYSAQALTHVGHDATIPHLR